MLLHPGHLLTKQSGDDSSLDLRFAELKFLDPRFTFTRASNATYFDSDGVLQTAANNTPRFTHLPVSPFTSLGLLIEGSRTNDILQSANFGTTWGVANLAVTDNTTLGIFGTTTADTITDDATDDVHIIFQAGFTVTTNVDSVVSVYAKAGTHDYLFIDLQRSSANYCVAVFDLSDGTLGESQDGPTTGTVTSYTIEDVGGGWYRCTLVGKAAGTSLAPVIGFAEAKTGNSFDGSGRPTYEGTGTTLIVEAAQLEIDEPFVSSHIPTTMAAVVRAAETCVTTDVSWLNPIEGTIFTEARRDHIQTGTTAFIFYIESEAQAGNLPKLTVLGHNSSALLRGILTASGGGASANVDKVVEVAGTQHKSAFAYAQSDAALSVDGSTVATDNTVDVSTGYDEAYIGNGDTVSWYFGTIARIKVWKTRLPNARLIVETTSPSEPSHIFTSAFSPHFA